MRRLPVVVLSALVAGATACGQPPASGSDDTGDIDFNVDAGSSDSTSYPAFKPDVPQVQNFGGPVLTNPLIVPVFFANDDMISVSTLSSFDSSVGQSSYWTTAVNEYGVGPATSTPPYMSTDTASGTIEDSAIQAWILGKIANDPTFPKPTPNTIYAMHYPAGATIEISSGTLGGGDAYSCMTFGGYHDEIQLPAPVGGTGADGGEAPDAGDADAGDADAGDASDGGVAASQPYVAYAVIPRCTNFDNLQGLDGTTGAESHELVEASTDPYPDYDPAYVEVDEAHLAWVIAFGGGELGDMCAQDPQAFTQFSELPYVVQRIWSNKSALAGHDPCVPYLANEVYFNSVPDMSDTAVLSLEGQSFNAESFNVAQGSSAATPMNLFSDGPMNAPWTVEVLDESAAFGGPAATNFALDNDVGLNGDTLQLTVSPLSMEGTEGLGGDVFFVLSTASDGTAHLWVGTIGP